MLLTNECIKNIHDSSEWQGFQQLWKAGKAGKNFPVRENSGNLGKHKKSGGTQGICDSNWFSPVWGMFILCHVSKLCSLTDWLYWIL